MSPHMSIDLTLAEDALTSNESKRPQEEETQRKTIRQNDRFPFTN